MRSPWLSREYEKSTDVVVNEVDGNYELKNINTNASLLLSKVEYDKYERCMGTQWKYGSESV